MFVRIARCITSCPLHEAINNTLCSFITLFTLSILLTLNDRLYCIDKPNSKQWRNLIDLIYDELTVWEIIRRVDNNFGIIWMGLRPFEVCDRCNLFEIFYFALILGIFNSQWKRTTYIMTTLQELFRKIFQPKPVRWCIEWH